VRPPRAWIAKAPLAAVLAAAFALVPIGSSRAAGATSRSAKASGCDPSLVPADAPNLQTKMGSCPDGTTFSFAGGLYRITAQLPLGQGDSVVGAGSGTGGTEFRGSIVLPASSFAQSGALWVHTGDAQSVGIMGDPCEPGVQGCGYLDWVYRDGTFLSRVLSPCTSLGPDQFCIAYGANKIYLGQAPGSHLIEYSTVSGMLISGVRAPPRRHV